MANNIFNGAGAVIGFFVISGLCIHYPYRSKPLELLPFYARRYIRILIPLGTALGVGRLIKDDLTGYYHAILWSLIAEEIYYAIYPALRIAIRKLGWKLLLSLSYALAVGLIVSRPHALMFHQFGPGLTWAVGLPSWLLGCHLAETLGNANRPEVSGTRIWAWRLSMWGLGSAASALRFHAGIGDPVTLTLMSPLLYYWLRLELTRRSRVAVFEYGGKFSYSIYLFHGLAVAVWGFIARFLTGGAVLASTLQLTFVLAISYGFFLLIEQPSHNFARYAARFIAQLRKKNGDLSARS